MTHAQLAGSEVIMTRDNGRWATRVLIVVAMLVLLVPNSGCDEEGAMDEFRQVSAGIVAVFGAIVDGVFAVYAPDEESTSSDSDLGATDARPMPANPVWPL